METNRVIFNEIHLNYQCNLQDTPDPVPVIVPTVYIVVGSTIHQTTPTHVGETATNPFYSDWKGSLFKKFEKMQLTGTFCAPIYHFEVPPGKAILRSHIAFRVKNSDTSNSYDLYARTCTDGSNMQEGIDFQNSNSPVGLIDSIWFIVALGATEGLQLFFWTYLMLCKQHYF